MKEQETVWDRVPRNTRRHEGPGWSPEVKGTSLGPEGWFVLSSSGWELEVGRRE